MSIQVLGFNLDAWAALNLLIQFVLPLLVGLVTTKMTGRSSQALLLASLTLVATVGTQLLGAHATGQPFNPEQVILVAAVNFVVSTGAHYGLWKPTGLSALLLAMFDKSITAPASTDSAPATDAPAADAVPATSIVADVAPAADPAAVAASVASGARHLAVATDPAPAVDPASAPASRMAG